MSATVQMNDQLEDLRSSLRGYLKKHVEPLIEESECEHTSLWQIVPDLRRYGFVTGLVPESDGGDEISFATLAVLMEEAGRCWGSLRTTLNVLTIVPYVISAVATRAQKERYLSRFLTGESRAWIGITESEAGSDAAAMRTRAERDPRTADYIVSGQKLYITNGATQRHWGSYSHRRTRALAQRASRPSSSTVRTLNTKRGRWRVCRCGR